MQARKGKPIMPSFATRSSVFVDPQPRSFADFAVGEFIRTRARTIGDTDISAFAGLVGNYYPLHLDAEYAASTRFGQRVAHGSFIYSVAVGLMEMTGYYGDAIVALLGVTELKATAPVLAGTTIHVLAEVIQAVPSTTSRGGRLTLAYRVQDSDDRTIMEFTQTMLMRGDDA